MARVIGAKAHADRLRGMTGEDMIRRVGSALFAGGQLIQVEAQVSITNGAVSGKGHVPSLPGQPPKNDSGVLANNIETVQVEPLKVEVSSNAPYAAALEFGAEHKAGTRVRSFSEKSGKMGPIRMEFGDSKTAARPYMGPAVAKKRKEVVELVRRAVRSVTQSPRGT